jgi:hypothetical protein
LHNFFVRVLLYGAAIASLIWVFYVALEQRVVLPGFMKKVAAALGVYGTVAQAYLAADEGARRRENESKRSAGGVSVGGITGSLWRGCS